MIEPQVHPITCKGYVYNNKQRTAKGHTLIRLVTKKDQKRTTLCFACEAEAHILAMHGGTLNPDKLHIDIIKEIHVRATAALAHPELFTEDERTYLNSII